MMLPFFKVRENAKLPERAHASDAGADVFFCGSVEDVKGKNFSIKDEQTIEINPGGNCLLQTGLKVGLDHGFCLMVCNKSGIASKNSLVVGAHIIDSGFANEILIDLHNVGLKSEVINVGQKIAQFLLLPIIHFIPLESDNEESLYGMVPITMSDRGLGGFGSTGVK